MEYGFVTWSGKQYRSIVAPFTAEWQDGMCFGKLILVVVMWGDTRGIITRQCWWNHFYGRLLDSATFWTFHHPCFQMQENPTVQILSIESIWHLCLMISCWAITAFALDISSEPRRKGFVSTTFGSKSCIKQTRSTLVLKLTSVCLYLQKMEGHKRKVCSQILFYFSVFLVLLLLLFVCF